MDLAQVIRRADRGYAMAGLLVGMAIMALFMSVAMPTWRHAIQREKEAELIFRGTQYARAVELYKRKYAGAGPPNLEILIEQKFLRKKYLDPITGGEFELLGVQPVGPGQAQPGVPPGGAARGGRSGFTPQPTGGGLGSQARTGRGSTTSGAPNQRAQGQLIAGVRSKSGDRSIRVHNGRSVYKDWQFVYTPWRPYEPTMDPAEGTSTTPGRRPSTGRGGSRRPTTPGVRPGTSPFPGSGSRPRP